MFKQRTTPPEAGNPFYTHVDAGGYNKCIRIRGNSVLPNCVGYAYGRFMEECGATSCNLSTGNAQNWYGYPDGYPRGQTPKVGAVMCWNRSATGTYGHVAIVEEVLYDGTVVASMSNWTDDGSLPYWERRTYPAPYNSPTGLPFQGFIYNPALEAEPLRNGMNTRKINDVEISVYKVAKGLKQGLIRAPQGSLQLIEKFDMDGILIYERCGNDYFQMKSGQADPVGTVYGPRVCMDGHVDMPEDSEHFLYYAIMKDGSVEFGDWDGRWRDPSNIEVMFSPGLIFYQDASGNRRIKYAPTMASYTAAQWRAYIGRTSDGTYLKGVSTGPLTPDQMWNYLHGSYDVIELCFMDGGSADAGSAQQTYWDGTKSVTYQSSGRATGDMLATYQPISTDMIPGIAPDPEPLPIKDPEPIEPTPQEPEKPAEEKPVDQDPHQDPVELPEVPTIIVNDDQENPMDKEVTIKEQIAKLIDVKSLMTFALIGTLCYMQITGKPIDQQFMTIVTAVTTFYFSYQVKKNSNDQK